MSHTLDTSKLEQVFQGLEDNFHKLTSWEIDFVEQIKALWKAGVELSDKRLEKLEEIWQKV